MGSELSPLAKSIAAPTESQPIPFKELQGLGDGMKLQPTGAGETPSGFGNVLGRLVGEVNEKQVAAGDAVKGLLSGQSVPLHQAVIAMEEANVSFQLMVEVRNRVLEAYQELMRMQV